MSTARVRATSNAAAPLALPSALHLARRLTFGPTPQVLAEIEADPGGWIEAQLQPGRIPDGAVDDTLARVTGLQATANDLRLSRSFGDRAVGDLRLAAIYRAVRSRRQVQELMVDFWHDHLVASAAKGAVAWHLPAYDRKVIRPFALGRFTDLLRAATRSGAMLEYLDTTRSRRPDVNENHGRELLELHTVGPEAGYTEADVSGAAAVLSGWTLDKSTLGVVFEPGRHHTGPVSVLGWSTPGRSGAGGAADLDRMLDHLARHPATAHRLASRLARRFVSERPSAQLVEAAAATYLAHDTSIAALLRHLFTSTEMRSGGGPLVRRPFDLLAALLRATGAELDVETTIERLVPLSQGLDPILPGLLDPLMDATAILDPLVPAAVQPLLSDVTGQRALSVLVTRIMRLNDQNTFAAAHPSGNPLAGATWSTGDALLRRWSLAALLASDQLPGVKVDRAALTGHATTVGAAVDRMALRCLGHPLDPPSRDTAIGVAGRGADGTVDGQVLVNLLSFILSLPEVQTR